MTMTPNERALLLAVAKEIHREFYGPESKSQDLISAVEAEAAFAADDEAELAEVAAKAVLLERCQAVRDALDGEADVCQTCHGTGKAARLPLGEPCRSCTGHIRENNPIRCAECSPTAHQNYERSLWQAGEDR